jgi:hypothetical protein
MCIVIDANLFSAVAHIGTRAHSEFKPLFEWVSFGRGKFVHGGTKYEREIKKNSKFRNWVYQLEKKGKTVPVEKEPVDFTADYLEQRLSGRHYNDHHIVAIVIVSGCKLICSLDQGLSNLINDCYQPQVQKMIRRNCPCTQNPSRPRIYKNPQKHGDLLSDKYIAKCCV